MTIRREPLHLPPVEQLTERYGMTIAESAEVLVPCGKNKGIPLGKAPRLDLRWLAGCRTHAGHSPEFRHAVKAARIYVAHLRAERLKNKAGEKAIKSENTAKRVTVSCRDCGQEQRIPRLILDRRRHRCFGCGGVLDLVGLPPDEYVNMTEAANMTGIAVDTLRKAYDRGEIVGEKTGGQWRFSLSSVESFAMSRRNLNALSELGVDVRTHHVCPYCKTTFRNFSAMALHIKEKHEDF